jgi:hypothetical protein
MSVVPPWWWGWPVTWSEDRARLPRGTNTGMSWVLGLVLVLWVEDARNDVPPDCCWSLLLLNVVKTPEQRDRTGFAVLVAGGGFRNGVANNGELLLMASSARSLLTM